MAPRKGPETQSGAKRFISLVGRVCRATYQAAFKPSIHSFFLWSFLIYMVCALGLLIVRPAVKTQFCAEEKAAIGKLRADWSASTDLAEKNAIQGEITVGCNNCSDNLLMCPKPPCFRSAVNITYSRYAVAAKDALYEPFLEASRDVECNNIYKAPSTTDPLGLVLQVIAAYTSGTVTESCRRFACGVLGVALSEPDLNDWTGNCTNVRGSKFRNEDSCTCSSLLTLTDDAGAASLSYANVADCGEDLKAVMDNLCLQWQPAAPVWPIYCVSTTSTTSTSTTETTTSSATTTTTVATTTTVVRRLEELDERSPEVAAREGFQSVLETAGGDIDLHRDRRLQTAPTPAPTPAAATADLPDYEVGDWSTCTCLQQCIPGVQTRIVQCDSGTCAPPMPTAKQGCECAHCVACMSSMFTLILMICFFVQAALALFVFACFLHTSMETEEDFVKMGICRRCGGFFVKQVPPIVRLMVLVNLVQLIFMVVQVFVAKLFNLSSMMECFHSVELRNVTIINCVFWIVQVIMGRFAKTYTRRPDWLYVPERPGWGFPIKQIQMLLRSLGP